MITNINIFNEAFLKNKLKKIGLTGNIGAGKTYISQLFHKEFNVPIYNCDDAYKKIASTNSIVDKKIINLLGDNAYTNPNADFKKLADLVFNDKELLKKYDDIIYPYFIKDLNNFCNANKKENYILIESAILFEYGLDKMMDDIITVVSDENTRLKRILKRNPNLSVEDIKKRFKLQMSEDIKKSKSKYVIDNNLFDNNLISKIKIIHNDIINS